MDLPFGVLGIYTAFAAWIIILIRDLKRGSYGTFILFGIALMLFLNLRYFIEGNPAAITFFIDIYDVFDNLVYQTLKVPQHWPAAQITPAPSGASDTLITPLGVSPFTIGFLTAVTSETPCSPYT